MGTNGSGSRTSSVKAAQFKSILSGNRWLSHISLDEMMCVGTTFGKTNSRLIPSLHGTAINFLGFSVHGMSSLRGFFSFTIISARLLTVLLIEVAMVSRLFK
jgi:hypothetical protein